MIFCMCNSVIAKQDLVSSNVRLQPITARSCLSIPPENIRKPKGFLLFSGGIDKQHQAVMGNRMNLLLPFRDR